VKPITSGGETIFPDEVEAVLRYHPDVADAVVVGLPDPMMGEYLVALIAAPPGQRAPTVEEVRGFCVGRLSGFKVPLHVLGVPAIRRDGSKIDRQWSRATAADLLGGAAPS
jgi:acyl-CoA synthetase (AMP-forming)/AMP-acid ligase II